MSVAYWNVLCSLLIFFNDFRFIFCWIHHVSLIQTVLVKINWWCHLAWRFDEWVSIHWLDRDTCKRLLFRSWVVASRVYTLFKTLLRISWIFKNWSYMTWRFVMRSDFLNLFLICKVLRFVDFFGQLFLFTCDMINPFHNSWFLCFLFSKFEFIQINLIVCLSIQESVS